MREVNLHISSNAPGLLKRIKTGHQTTDRTAGKSFRRVRRGLVLFTIVYLLLFQIPQVSAAGITRGPYLQQGTSTSVVLRWRTDAPADSRVIYGLNPSALTYNIEQPTYTTEHELQLTGLKPDTKYYYAIDTYDVVMTGGDEAHSFVTAPPAGTNTPTRVWILGDSGSAGPDAEAVRDGYVAYSNGQTPDFWIMLGDNAYGDGLDDEYQTAVFDMYPGFLKSSVLWSTIGNHDGHSAYSYDMSGPYYDIFTLPTDGSAGGVPSGTEAYYSFDYGNIHFICLDSFDSDRGPGSAMLAWLEQDLLETTQDWIIAFWHHPPYSKGSHDSDEENELIEMREYALPILEDYGVDLVLSGHSHSYERSFLIDGHYGSSDTLTGNMIVDSGDGDEYGTGAYKKLTGGTAPHEGAVYVVAGSSGKISEAPLDHPVMYRSLLNLGSLELNISDGFLDARFIGTDGAILDSFTINKGNVPLSGAALQG